MKKIGLFFGSFNPIHVGHLIIANHLVQESDLDQVWFVVSPHNPLKKKSSLLSDHHRLMLVNIAIEDNLNLKASSIEFDLPQPNYTVYTLQILKEKYPEYEFSLIMGEDNLRSFHRWKNYEYILNNYRVFIYPRVKTADEENPATELLEKGKFIRVNAPIIEISSTAIRNGIADKKDVRYLLTEPVFKYIDEMNFYR